MEMFVPLFSRRQLILTPMDGITSRMETEIFGLLTLQLVPGYSVSFVDLDT